MNRATQTVSPEPEQRRGGEPKKVQQCGGVGVAAVGAGSIDKIEGLNGVKYKAQSVLDPTSILYASATKRPRAFRRHRRIDSVRT